MISDVLSIIGAFWLPLSIGLLFLYVFYLKRRARYFQDRGIPGPEVPSLFLGHLKEKERDGKWFVRYKDWEEQYGKTFGIYEGGHRIIVTSDLDILDDVFNKQFNKFHSRKIGSHFAGDQTTFPGLNLFLSEGARWKRLRALVAGVFATGKIRSTEGVTNDTISAVVREIEKDLEKSEVVDLKPHFLNLSLDVIERVSLGREKTLVGSGIKDEFAQHLLDLFTDKGVSSSWIRSFFAGIYEFRRVASFLFTIFATRNLPELMALQKKLQVVFTLKKEQKDTSDTKDFVNHLMESRIDEANLQDCSKTVYDKKVQKNLTEEEIISCMVMFLIAGYDTTATTLMDLCYRLAQNPDVQEKLYDEICTHVFSDEDLTMSTVQNMQYLDWCVKEGLRMDPHATEVVQRRCMETTTVGKDNKIEIEKGVCVATNAYSIHYNEELWKDPHEFRPERFSPEGSSTRHPLAWQPFGIGPRICVGMRFALLETKLAVTQVVKKFKFHLSTETEFDCSGNIIVSPNTMKLRLEKR
ncbi:hypothetical protein QR680_011317 [Steinernema hermaphroditum]|uniref:Cytochrome P450 n=1 Tax=Steinernema hermaphroditum TaxID=289476 RepID=A0AA39IRV3_9BILA|nr:hypothetical protein QR680_011317 [Steinernema hermaphroditum]